MELSTQYLRKAHNAVVLHLTTNEVKGHDSANTITGNYMSLIDNIQQKYFSSKILVSHAPNMATRKQAMHAVLVYTSLDDMY